MTKISFIRLTLSLCVILASFKFSFSQQTDNIASTGKELSGSFILSDTLAKKDLVYNYKITIDATGKIITHITNVEGTETLDKTFSLFSKSSAESYYASFANVFSGKNGIPKRTIRENAISIFAKIEGRIEIKDDEPNTAHLKLLKRILPISIAYSSEQAKNENGIVKPILAQVEQVDIEFEDGAIKNFSLTVKVDKSEDQDKLEDGRFLFRNNFPIGMSGKFSPERLRDNVMFAYDPCRLVGLYKSVFKVKKDSDDNQTNNEGCIISSAKFNLAELIDFRLILESDKEDYSPANQVVTLTPDHDLVTLKKDKRSKIFEVRSYTDLVGIDGKSPNGLIQIEARKKIFLLEDKKRFLSDYAYFGGMGYIEPVVRFSKIDNNNKNLIPDTLGTALNLSKQGKKVLNVNTIDLYRYQKSSFQVNLNILTFSFPQVKFSVLLDGRAGAYRTSIADSLTFVDKKLQKGPVEFVNTVNVVNYGLNLFVKFLPDSRYQFSIGYGWIANKMLDEKYQQLHGKGIGSFWIDGYFKTSDSSKLFIRGSFNQQNSDTRLNFIQAQLGVTLDIFRVNSKL